VEARVEKIGMTKIKEKEVEEIRGQETRGEREGQKTKKRVYNGSK